MIRIIPAIDIIGGKCVRLALGNYSSRKIYDNDPLVAAKRFENAGIRYLHLVDLDGAREKKIINWPVLERIATYTTLHIDFGGGVQSSQDLKIAFDCGAQQVTAGSIAINNKEMVLDWLKRYTPEKIILGADSKNKKIAVSGWQQITSVNLINFLKDFQKTGIRYIICTDISRDGLLQGSNIDLYKEIKTALPNLFVIASGGITAIEEIGQLNDLNIDGVIIGKALYENRISLEQLKDYLC